MQTTANYGFKKPDGVETVNIDDLNYNADVADVELKKRALQTDFSSHLADNTAHGIGDKTKLSTTAKDTIVAAINEVFQSGTSVKSSTISAVNSKGGNLSTTATWNQIIAAINSIARGQGNAVESQVLSGADFSNSDGILRHGSMPNNGTVVLTPTTVNQAIEQGYHPGTGYVKGDANLVTSNIKSGVSIFGVSGKSSVVETTESANPIAASTVRSGKIGYVNGSKITGSLAVQATAAQTVIPGNSDIVKGAGIYDATITIKGDSNLQSPNILKDKSIFGVTGTAEEKQDLYPGLPNFPGDGTNYEAVSYIKGEGLYCNKSASVNNCYLFNTAGTLIKTITASYNSYSLYPVSVTKNYILWTAQGNTGLLLTDKNGTTIIGTSSYFLAGAIDEVNSKIYVAYSSGVDMYIRVYNLSLSSLGDYYVTDGFVDGIVPLSNGVLALARNDNNIAQLFYVDPVNSRRNQLGYGAYAFSLLASI